MREAKVKKINGLFPNEPYKMLSQLQCRYGNDRATNSREQQRHNQIGGIIIRIFHLLDIVFKSSQD